MKKSKFERKARKRAAKSARQRIRETAAVARSAEVPEFPSVMPQAPARDSVPVRECPVVDRPSREV